jgi:hypothetical protein
LNNEKFHVVKDPAVLKRLSPQAREHVFETNMDEQGITDFGTRAPHGFSRLVNAPLELFFNDKPLTLSRWPNHGMLPVGTVVDRGSNLRNGDKDNRGAQVKYNFSRPSSWEDKKDIWVYGIFANGYSEDYLQIGNIDKPAKIIKLKDPSNYGIYSTFDENVPGKSVRYRGYYFYNILEELDSAGEWYLDQDSHHLYVWPPDDIKSSTLIVSQLETPLVILYHTANLSLRNITFTAGRGIGLYAAGTENTNVTGCTFSNFGTRAISLADVVVPFKFNMENKLTQPDKADNTGFNISHCTIYNTGTGAIRLKGGDRRNLISAKNSITDCEVFNYSRINRSSPAAIAIAGVGISITHCFIHDGSSAAIGFTGNNQVIAYNHIKQVATGFSDIGAVYSGRDPSATGTRIEYNFFDSIESNRGYAVAAVYIDDGSGGIVVSKNIFYACGASSAGGYGAIHVNGGADNVFDNNYFINCKKAFTNNVWGNRKWKSFISKPDIIKKVQDDVDIRSQKYLREYPHLKSFYDTGNVKLNRVNYVSNTLLFNVKTLVPPKSSFVVANTYRSADGNEFEDFKTRNFNLKSIPETLHQVADWEAIPFDKTGLLDHKDKP